MRLWEAQERASQLTLDKHIRNGKTTIVRSVALLLSIPWGTIHLTHKATGRERRAKRGARSHHALPQADLT